MRDETVARFDYTTWRREWRAARKARGICIDCPELAQPGRVACVICAERSANRKRRHRGGGSREEYLAKLEQQRAYKAERRAQGLCHDCPDKALPRYRSCAACLELKRMRERERREAGTATPHTPTAEERRRSKNKRRALGLCADCGEAAERSASRCERCAEIHRHRERLAQRYGRPDYLAHFHKELPLWERALLARGQVRKIGGRFIPFREKKAS